MNEISIRPRARVQGTAIVEAAIVLPLLLLLVFGALEYGWMFVVQGQIVNAARQGIRIGINPGESNADIITQVGHVMTTAGLAKTGYTVTFGNGTNPQPDAASAPSGTVLYVTVAIPNYQANVSLTHLTSLLPTPTSLQATVAMTKEGPP